MILLVALSIVHVFHLEYSIQAVNTSVRMLSNIEHGVYRENMQNSLEVMLETIQSMDGYNRVIHGFYCERAMHNDDIRSGINKEQRYLDYVISQVKVQCMFRVTKAILNPPDMTAGFTV